MANWIERAWFVTVDVAKHRWHVWWTSFALALAGVAPAHAQPPGEAARAIEAALRDGEPSMSLRVSGGWRSDVDLVCALAERANTEVIPAAAAHLGLAHVADVETGTANALEWSEILESAANEIWEQACSSEENEARIESMSALARITTAVSILYALCAAPDAAESGEAFAEEAGYAVGSLAEGTAAALGSRPARRAMRRLVRRPRPPVTRPRETYSRFE